MEQTETVIETEPLGSGGAMSEPCASESGDELTQLRERVRKLETQLEQGERARRECEEFEEYFPEVSLRGLPDEVWARVRSGESLCAAYALYEARCRRKSEAERREAERVAAMSVGIPDEAGRDYFSPAQVRAMSQREVRENYDRIFESMRHWQ